MVAHIVAADNQAEEVVNGAVHIYSCVLACFCRRSASDARLLNDCIAGIDFFRLEVPYTSVFFREGVGYSHCIGIIVPTYRGANVERTILNTKSEFVGGAGTGSWNACLVNNSGLPVGASTRTAPATGRKGPAAYPCARCPGTETGA